MDVIDSYKKHQLIGNILIVIASLVMAFSINIFLIEGTGIGKNLKANILQAGQENNKMSDIYISNKSGNITIKTNKNINNLKNLSFSLSYNPEDIEIIDIKSSMGEITNISNTPGINSILLNLKEAQDVKPGDSLGTIKINKKDETLKNLNLINANFKDSKNDMYILTTSGINF